MSEFASNTPESEHFQPNVHVVGLLGAFSEPVFITVDLRAASDTSVAMQAMSGSIFLKADEIKKINTVFSVNSGNDDVLKRDLMQKISSLLNAERPGDVEKIHPIIEFSSENLEDFLSGEIWNGLVRKTKDFGGDLKELESVLELAKEKERESLRKLIVGDPEVTRNTLYETNDIKQIRLRKEQKEGQSMNKIIVLSHLDLGTTLVFDIRESFESTQRGSVVYLQDLLGEQDFQRLNKDLLSDDIEVLTRAGKSVARAVRYRLNIMRPELAEDREGMSFFTARGTVRPFLSTGVWRKIYKKVTEGIDGNRVLEVAQVLIDEEDIQKTRRSVQKTPKGPS